MIEQVYAIQESLTGAPMYRTTVLLVMPFLRMAGRIRGWMWVRGEQITICEIAYDSQRDIVEEHCADRGS